ncbi:beta-N-acetylhexosaminidase [Shivajiella indica]|uniref:beta-N-acetylhexosaminidase n=1 Tax=Shivajiella indica TaxID=872115 RepID=A0ABW5B877_9BACT
MKKNIASIFLILLGMGLYSCSKEKIAPLSQENVIPLPVSVSDIDGNFQLNGNTKIVSLGDAAQLNGVAEYLKSSVYSLTALNLSTAEQEQDNAVILELNPNSGLEAEAYQLTIDDKNVRIMASQPAGLFYGVQSLKQLIPAHGKDLNGTNNSFKISAGKIEDKPEYAYRGFMLDVARHFFSVEDVKHLIDQIAEYKINHLHLHLSDDQGWRIEIKSWPLLTTIGGSTQVGGQGGGFYTQEDYKEIVKYAMDHFITIVPEIDMPGHTNSALASYGELNPGITVPEQGALPYDRSNLGVDGMATPLYTGTEVGFSTLATNKEVTYKFIEDVIREISEITPGPYFHIGGDESHVTAIEDYIPFIERAQDIVTKYGKKTLGWDEVAHAKLLPTSVAQYWAKAENAIMAIEQGAQVLISPAVKAYLDMKYDSTTHIGYTWAALIELDEAYNWDPTGLEEQIKRENILGVEAPLWTETITTRAEIEYMVFPRLAAIAEIAWTPKNLRNWDSFSKRIAFHGQRWEAKGINFYKSPKVNW